MSKMLTGPTFNIEDSFGSTTICGVDEAGRGPLAGPVVAAAVILDRSCLPDGIMDSKKIPAHKRQTIFDCLMDTAMVSIGAASVEEIDQFNILGATKLAMLRAVEGLAQPAEVALIDGNQPPKLACKTHAVVKGDSLSLSIAAASIIAKVTRDRMMEDLDTLYPHYGFAKHAGYGTKSHMAAIEAHGVCPAHRRSFAPVRTALEKLAA